MRFGVVVFISVFTTISIITLSFGYWKFVRTGQLEWSEMLLGVISNLISPCVIQHQTSGMIAYFSSFVIMQLTILMTVMLTVLHKNPTIWNDSSDFRGTKFLFLNVLLIYCPCPQLCKCPDATVITV